MGQIQCFLALSSGYCALTSLYPLITNFRSTIAYFRLSILTSFKLGCRPFVIYSGHYFCCPGQLSTYVVLNCLLQHNIVQMDLKGHGCTILIIKFTFLEPFSKSKCMQRQIYMYPSMYLLLFKKQFAEDMVKNKSG